MDKDIQKFLESQSHHCTSSEIANALGCSIRKITPTLRRLHRSKQVQQVQESPPTWRMHPQDLAIVVSPFTHRRLLPKVVMRVDVEDKILEVLQQKNDSASTQELVKTTGVKEKKELNKILYKLQKQGLLVKVSNAPPKWGLKHPITLEQDVSLQENIPVISQDHDNEEEDDFIHRDTPMSDDSSGHSDEHMTDTMDNKGGDYVNCQIDMAASPSMQKLSIDVVAMETMNEELQNSQPIIDNGSQSGVVEQRHLTETITPNLDIVARNKETLKIQLLAALKEQSEPIHANSLAKLVGMTSKKDINPILFPMQNMGLVSKVSNVPPKWIITDKGAENLIEQTINMPDRHDSCSFQVPPDPRQVIQQPGFSVLNQPLPATTQVNRIDLEKALIQTLISRESYKAIDLARAVGFQSKKDINPTLFHLQRKGLTKKINDSPPTWCVTEKGKQQLDSTKDMAVGTLTVPAPEEDMYRVCPNPLDLLQKSGDSNQDQSVLVAQICPPCTTVCETAVNTLTSEAFAVINKNPISALMEYAQSRQFKCSIDVLYQSGPPHSPRFTMAASVNGRRFPSVISKSKKDGKREAADKALRVLIAEGSIKPQMQSTTIPNNNKIFNSESLHADKIAVLSHQTFNAVVANIPECISGRKILAALVMFKDTEEQGTVVCLGTGNRCVTGDMLSLEGHTVNDSHAEIITRRSFLRYLYQQLDKYLENPAETIFESKPSGKLGVQQGITFHLYISTAPCGDGAQFSRGDSSGEALAGTRCEDFTGNASHQPTFTKSIQGLLRTKMEGGEGTIPIDPDSSVQTWDGIIRGERLRTMSCSDKIARWNILGLQGALLTHFIEPIYLASVTLGSLYHHGHLSRALCCRLSHKSQDREYNSTLPAPYQLHHPQLGCVTAFDPPRETEKTKALSINWCINDPKAEVTDGTKGRCLERTGQSNVSQVAKASLYKEFRSVCEKMKRQDVLQANTYHKAKKMAREYQEAKAFMMECFDKNGFGKWMEKPPEEEMFTTKEEECV
ncbi:uncharacterized protein LOC144440849 [Glandiceps talaboti]